MTDPDSINARWACPIFRRVAGEGDNVDIAALRALILASQDEALRLKSSPQPLHRKVYESSFDFLNWKDPEVLRLKQLIHRWLAEVIRHTSTLPNKALMRLSIESESWFHVTESGGYVRDHNHPQHSWSAIFCVDPGDLPAINDDESGHVVFGDPRGHAGMFLDPANAYMKSEYNFHSLRFRPRKGEVIIFPSYVWHAVEPYVGETPRITVAGNFRFKLPPGVAPDA